MNTTELASLNSKKNINKAFNHEVETSTDQT